MTKQEGVIKFTLEFSPGDPLPAAQLAELNAWRDTLYTHKLIGQDPERYGGYGYGNLSMRLAPYDGPPAQRRFAISGTQTGHLVALGPEHYAIVTACYPAENRVIAHGPIRPSSESLTHGAVYAIDPAIRYVMHAHSPVIWQRAANLHLPTTDPAVTYGTPQMADEVQRLFAQTPVATLRVFVMGGHEDGIVSFGHTAAEAGDVLLAALAAATA
jgi:ribulose-5-phosphate 4-epimerase/fuculose-1-phosphate aldolase